MNKKSIYIGCVLFVLIVLSGMLIFIFSDTLGDDPTNLIDITGSWRIVANVEYGRPTFIDNECVVFDEEIMNYYKTSTREVEISSKYSIDSNKTIFISNNNKSYVIDKKTHNVVCLYESKDKYTILLRNIKNNSLLSGNVKDVIIGKWKVICKAGSLIENVNEEILDFSESVLNDYRNGESKPTMSSIYSVGTNNNIFVEKLDKQLRVLPLSNNTVVLIELDNGYVWEIERIE